MPQPAGLERARDRGPVSQGTARRALLTATDGERRWLDTSLAGRVPEQRACAHQTAAAAADFSQGSKVRARITAMASHSRSRVYSRALSGVTLGLIGLFGLYFAMAVVMVSNPDDFFSGSSTGQDELTYRETSIMAAACFGYILLLLFGWFQMRAFHGRRTQL